MSAIGIELVDAAVVAVRDGVRLAASPGVALLESTGVVVGEAAAAGMRLKPVLAADRFWSDLSVDSWAQGGAAPVSHAELAHAHLSSLWRAIAKPEDSAVFALPGAMRLHQVGLLLGIARRAGIPLAGVVDAAVAACAGLAARRTVLHLDVQLHQAVLTELAGPTVLRRRRVDVAPRAGLKAMLATWAQLVAEAMVRRTRFDPLHQAATEQQLHERLSSRSRPRPGTRSWRSSCTAAIARTSRRRSPSRCARRCCRRSANGSRRCRGSNSWCCRRTPRRPRRRPARRKSARRNRPRWSRRCSAPCPWPPEHGATRAARARPT
jgi:hypothetical protein